MGKEQRMVIANLLKVPAEIPREKLAQDLGLILSKNPANEKDCLLTSEGTLFSTIEEHERAPGVYFLFFKPERFPGLAKTIEELGYIKPFLKDDD